MNIYRLNLYSIFDVELLSSLMDTVRIRMDALFALTDSVVIIHEFNIIGIVTKS
jgi:hypothetical protein